MSNILRVEQFLIDHHVTCATCGKEYIPSDIQYMEELGVTLIMANNWCCRKCYDNMGK